MEDFDDKLEELRKAKHKYRWLQREAEEAKTAHDTLQAEIFQIMRDRKLLTHKAEDASYSRKSTIYGHVRDREAFAAWCRENDYAEEMLVVKEKGQPLNELVRAMIDNGEELPPGVGWYAKEYVSITESKEN